MEKYKWKVPVYANQKINEYLKEIGTLCEIDTVLTSHIGRKTFATIALNKGVSIEVFSRMCGHANINITLSTHAEIMNDRMISEMSKLEF